MSWLKDKNGVQAIAAAIEALAVVVTLGFTFWVTNNQLDLTRDSLELTRESVNQIQTDLNSNAASSVYAAQLEINKLMLDHEDIVPYIYYREFFLAEDGDLRREAEMVAGSLLDFFEHVRYLKDRGAFEASESAWASYIRGTFATSPLLCEHLKALKDWYGGDDPGFLWASYAKADCEPLLYELENRRRDYRKANSKGGG
jgi:hypothetical protein